MTIISKQLDGSSKFLGVGSLFLVLNVIPRCYIQKENTVEFLFEAELLMTSSRV